MKVGSSNSSYFFLEWRDLRDEAASIFNFFQNNFLFVERFYSIHLRNHTWQLLLGIIVISVSKKFSVVCLRFYFYKLLNKQKILNFENFLPCKLKMFHYNCLEYVFNDIRLLLWNVSEIISQHSIVIFPETNCFHSFFNMDNVINVYKQNGIYFF